MENKDNKEEGGTLGAILGLIIAGVAIWYGWTLIF